ncbi:MAG: hypothetical protein IPF54_16255 [Draconibacterium sp.]|nr:hypothetical protein [Draconibacterium sp.]
MVNKIYEFGNKRVKEHDEGIREFLERKDGTLAGVGEKGEISTSIIITHRQNFLYLNLT